LVQSARSEPAEDVGEQPGMLVPGKVRDRVERHRTLERGVLRLQLRGAPQLERAIESVARFLGGRLWDKVIIIR
jgi:hypothetical protein